MSTKPERLWAATAIEAMFADDTPLTVVPWEQASKRRTQGSYDRDLVRALLATVPLAETFLDLDPRDLCATQPFVTRAALAYYLDDGYRRHGRTWADLLKVGNKYPVVYRRAGQNLILSGHHRAAAALLRGRTYCARVIDGPWGLEYGRDVDVVSLERAEIPSPSTEPAPVFLTPSLLIGATDVPHLSYLTIPHTADALNVIEVAGRTARLPYDLDDARVHEAITRLSPTPEWAAHQLHYAATGRLLPVGEARGHELPDQRSTS